MKKHKHKWMSDGYDSGWICRCGAWSPDKEHVYTKEDLAEVYT